VWVFPSAQLFPSVLSFPSRPFRSVLSFPSQPFPSVQFAPLTEFRHARTRQEPERKEMITELPKPSPSRRSPEPSQEHSADSSRTAKTNWSTHLALHNKLTLKARI